jgi:hypothetical protein
MSVRLWNFVPLAAAAAVALPSTVSAPPATYKYRISSRSMQEIDATAAGQGKQSMRSNTDLFVTVSLADTAGGRTLHLVMDSLVVDTTTGGPLVAVAKAQADSLKGAAFHAYLPAGGDVTGLKAMKEGGSTQQVDGIVRMLFVPKMKSGTKVGDAWTDSTSSSNPTANGSVSVRTTTSYKAVANETQDGAKATVVEGKATTSRNGTQGEATFEGTGTTDIRLLVDPSGRTLSGTALSTTSLQLVIPQLPEPLPVTAQDSTTITSIK